MIKNLLKTGLLLFVIVLSSCKSQIPLVSDDSFNQFWTKTKFELNKIPLVHKKIKTRNLSQKTISLFKIKSFDEVDFYVWVSEPKKDGKYNTKVKFSGFSRGNTDFNNIPQDEFIMENNTICAMVDVRGQGLSTDQIKFKDFLEYGNHSKETFIYRGAFMDALRVIDFVATNPKSNGKILTIGGSQGGLLSLVATALNQKVDICIANFPFLADTKSYKKRDWPLSEIIKGLSKKEALAVLTYFDATRFAKLVRVPVFISCAEYDKITPLEGVRLVYENIKHDKKQFFVESCEGHGCSAKSEFVLKKQEEFMKLLVRF